MMNEVLESRVSPPKLGGVAVRTRDFAKPPLKRTDGVVPEPKHFKNAFVKRFDQGTTTSAPPRWLRNIFWVAATPPNLGGDTPTETLHPD